MRRQTLVLGTIFVLSGFAGLVYQVAWQRLLTVYYGVGAISVTLIVSVYMAGLGVGGWLGGRIADKAGARIGPYLATELSLGIFGLLSVPFLDALGRATAGASYVLTALLAFAFLAIPTVLMGMTLPLVVKLFDGWLQNFGATVSTLYFLNTLGAAVGALVAAWGLISFFGLGVAVWCAAGINLTLAAAILLLRQDASTPAPVAAVSSEGPERLALLLVFASGFIAIGDELVWFRLIGVMVKDSPYAFATVLSVYLLGIALGSLLVQRRLRRGVADARSLFLLLQALVGFSTLALVAALFHLARGPMAGLVERSFRQELHPSFSGDSLFAALDVFFWPAFLLFIPTLCMGASFPLITSVAYRSTGSEGRTVGAVYFSNLLGNLFGGALTGLVLLPVLGTERTLLGFGALGLLAALGVRSIPIGARAGAAVASLLLLSLVFPRAGELYAVLHKSDLADAKTYFEESRDGVVLTREAGDEVENFINGQAHGGRPFYPFVYEAVEAVAHAKKVERILVIGFGSGSVAEVALQSEAAKVTLVELNAGLLDNLRKLPRFKTVLEDPRLEIIIDDARRELIRSDRRYDLVLMDPLRTTTAYSNNLYSRQFFELVKSRLTEGGVLLIWSDEFRVVPRTVATVFEEVKLGSFFMLASPLPLVSDDARREALLARMSTADREGVASVHSRWVADRARILEKSSGVPINEDLRPAAEYYLGIREPSSARSSR